MKLAKSFLVSVLSLSLVSVSFLSFTTQTIFAQDSRIALQRGYRTGYSDGYMSGYRDAIENAVKSYDKHGEYTKADRAYSKDYGSLEEYRDGYQQGFEGGYDTGFEKRSFDAAIPINLTKRGVIVAATTTIGATTTTKTTIEEKSPTETVIETVVTNKVEEPVAKSTVENKVEEPIIKTTVENQVSENTPTITNTTAIADMTGQPPVITAKTTEKISSDPSGEMTILVPTDTELIVELLEDINTERNKEGDRFKARVISPNEINGAIIEGRVSKIQKPGRIKRRSEILLSFDRIVLSENRWSNFSAILTEVLPVKGDNVKRVDIEGTVEGKSSIKSDSVKIGAATGTGLVIGAIAGGPVGAAVGAGVGAAFGVGAVVVERGKHIRLNKDQQLRIKSAYETQIR